MIQSNYIETNDSLRGLKKMPSSSVDCIVTSPPYWGLRDYGVTGQIGLEKDFNEYITKLVAIFSEAHRVLKDTGTLWVNMGDTYWGSMQGYGATSKSKTGFSETPKNAPYSAAHTGLPPMAAKHKTLQKKSLVMIPERFALAMIESGWILRNTIIWKKPNATPESAKDRFTNDYEHLFFFTKKQKYFFNQQFEEFRSNEYDIQRMKDGRKEYDGKYSTYGKNQKLKKVHRQRAFVAGHRKGRNKRAVWDINTKPFKEAHFAVFPEELIEIPIQAGCPKNGIVLDPFMGSGTTAVVAQKLGRKYIGIELNPKYVKLANKRIAQHTQHYTQKELAKMARQVMNGLNGLEI